MSDKQTIKNEKEVDLVPKITIKSGNKTYIVGMHYADIEKETIEERIRKQLLRNANEMI